MRTAQNISWGSTGEYMKTCHGETKFSSPSIALRRCTSIITCIILLSLAVVCRPEAADAEEARVFTNDDLGSYAGLTAGVDEETLARKEADLRAWRKKRDAELREADRRQALLERSRREAAQRRRYPSTAATGPVSGVVAGKASGMAGAANAAGMTGAAAAAGSVRKPT